MGYYKPENYPPGTEAILRYKLNLSGLTEITIPGFLRALSVGVQRNEANVWVLTCRGEPDRECRFHAIQTGQACQLDTHPDLIYEFVGTIFDNTDREARAFPNDGGNPGYRYISHVFLEKTY